MPLFVAMSEYWNLVFFMWGLLCAWAVIQGLQG